MRKLAVLMPNYNNAPFLREAIESVLTQSFTDFNFIIVDDKSTDDSIDIIRSYSDDRIKLYLKEENSGIVDTMNLGLDHLEAEYVIRMDGDDISCPDRFKTLVEYMDRHEDIGVCSTFLETFGAVNDKVITPTVHDELKAGLVFSSKIPHAPSIFRSTIFGEMGMRYRSVHKYLEDYDLFFRLKDKVNFHVIPEVFYKYRILEHNSTVRNMDTFQQRYHGFHQQVLNELRITPSETHLKLHFQFAKTGRLTERNKAYKGYKELLLAQNHALGIYPEPAFKKLIAERYHSLFYRICDQSSVKGFGALFQHSFSTGRLKYWIKSMFW